MLDTAVTLLTAKLKLVGVAVAAAALSTSAVAVTTVSNDAPLTDDAAVVVEEGEALELEELPTATPVAGGELPAGDDEGEDPAEEVEEEPVDEELEEPAAPDDAVALPDCPADVKNHGAYVSSVAKDKSVSGREHGKRVSAAAQSDCGKPAAEEPVEQEVVEAPETVEEQSVAPAPAPAPKAERKAAKTEAKAERKAERKAAAPKPAAPAGKGGGQGKGGGKG